MCIAVFLWQSHPLYQFYLLLNRDEFHDRPTEALAWWEDREVQILGGRDGLAGGTWMACSKNGRLAFLTNVRGADNVPLSKSRGDLPVRFLESKKNPREFAEEVMNEADQYNGFNLILADFPSKKMVFVSNRPKGQVSCVSEVQPGIHVLSNASLDTPWPKAQRLKDGFEEQLSIYGDSELPATEIADKLMMNSVKDDDESMLPGVLAREWEYKLSSVFVDTDSPLGRYGTRSTSVLSVKTDQTVTFYERRLEGDQWKEEVKSFLIAT